MKYINTLIPDVYEVLNTGKAWYSDEVAKDLSARISDRLRSQYGSSEGERRPTLRLSQMGPKCPRALWHSIHTPEEAEALPAWAEFKYTYGHLIEALALELAKLAGHTVEGEQDAVNVDGIVGHRDCVIDGCVVDVKSASSRVFEKFKTQTIAQADSFGYLDQLDGYLVGSSDDPLVRTKDRGYIWAIDKTLGSMVLYPHYVRSDSIRGRIAEYKSIVALEQPPQCNCGTVLDGKSGNVKLDVKASYSAYKYVCFPHLRTFLYASGPVYLTKVARTPDVVEVNRHGTRIN